MERDSRRIIFFNESGLKGGGSERVLSILLNEFAIENDVYFMSNTNAIGDAYICSPRVRRVVLGERRASNMKISAAFLNLWQLVKLRRQVSRISPDIVVSFQARSNIKIIIACFGMINQPKIVISERNDPSRQVFGWPWQQLRYLLYRRADLVTANTEHALNVMKSYVPSHKLKFTPNPINRFNVQINSAARDKVIINVARLVPCKRQDLILDALSCIKESAGVWSLKFYGDGPEKEKLQKKLASYNFRSDQVIFCGFLKDISLAYVTSSIFILSSEFEGTPNALIEAMSAGLACIVSDSVEGAKSLIVDGKNGLFFKYGDSKDLAEKLLRLMLNDDLRNSLATNAKKFIEEIPTDKGITIWKDLFDEII